MTVFSKDNKVILLKGWRDTTGAKLWRFSLRPEDNPVSSTHPSAPAPLASLNAHDLPWVSDLARYLHAAAGFPVKSTWLATIKAGNFSTWVVPAPDGTIYLVDINEIHYWGFLARYMYWGQKYFSEKIETYQYMQKKVVNVLMFFFSVYR